MSGGRDDRTREMIGGLVLRHRKLLFLQYESSQQPGITYDLRAERRDSIAAPLGPGCLRGG